MDRVGGFEALKLLEEDARAYELIEVALDGEADAATIMNMEAKKNSGR